MTEPPTLYDLLGGETGIQALVDRFYDLMDTAPEAQGIRSLHAKSLKQSREKLFMFLSGWAGGPALYMEKFGHPRLRMRHMPFAIGRPERDQWLWCMERAIETGNFDVSVKQHLKSRFTEIADFMRNQNESSGAPIQID